MDKSVFDYGGMFPPAITIYADKVGNPIFKYNCGLYLKKNEVSELIGLLNKYVETVDFEELRYKESLYFWNTIEKPYMQSALSLHKRNKKEGVVYFIKRKDGLIKIGCSSDFKTRLRNLKTQHGELEVLFTIETLNMYATEFCFHDIFKKERKDGEWFELEDFQLEYAKRGKYFEFISTTMQGNDFDFDLYFEEYYIRRKTA